MQRPRHPRHRLADRDHRRAAEPDGDRPAQDQRLHGHGGRRQGRAEGVGKATAEVTLKDGAVAFKDASGKTVPGRAGPPGLQAADHRRQGLLRHLPAL
ncbi:hypothetical protein ACRAWD_31310 [Caulobacter segnis]